MSTDRKIAGYCPMGCGETLFRGSGGYATCSSLSCPRPAAVTDLLDDRETEHVVEFKAQTFTVRHPLRERLDDALMRCKLDEHITNLAGPPVQLGRYRASLDDGRWLFVALLPPVSHSNTDKEAEADA